MAAGPDSFNPDSTNLPSSQLTKHLIDHWMGSGGPKCSVRGGGSPETERTPALRLSNWEPSCEGSGLAQAMELDFETAVSFPSPTAPSVVK